MRRRYSIDWYAAGSWYAIGRTWLTKWGALRACRLVMRNADCGAARLVIVRSPVKRSAADSSQPARPAIWSGWFTPGRRPAQAEANR